MSDDYAEALKDLTMPETFAWVFKAYGERGLRTCFDYVLEHNGELGWTESHEQAIAELRSLNLHKVADVLTEYLPHTKSFADHHAQKKRVLWESHLYHSNLKGKPCTKPNCLCSCKKPH